MNHPRGTNTSKKQMPQLQSQIYYQNPDRIYNDNYEKLRYNNCLPQQMQCYTEKIPYEKSYVDYVPQEQIEYIPFEQKYQDYIEIEHELDYIPVTKLEKYIDYVPVERYREHVEYVPQENSFFYFIFKYCQGRIKVKEQPYVEQNRQENQYPPFYNSTSHYPSFFSSLYKPYSSYDRFGSYYP